MQRLFRSFEKRGVAWLLISGQASILYGAATFSEDVDLWIAPTVENASRLLRALADCRATVYKLTPNLTLSNMRRGHGFHFLVPDRPLPIYLDVMARPPRVGRFRDARSRAIIMDTDWGRVPVVSIPDLILLKQTRRFSDYEVISNLVKIHLRREGDKNPSLVRWAASITCRPEDRSEYLARLGRPAPIEECRAEIMSRISTLQRRDTRYWSGIIGHLRALRARGGLIPEGTPIRSLLKNQ